MEKNKLVNLLCELNSHNPIEGNLPNEFYENKYTEICEKLNCSYEDIHNVLKKTTELYFSSELTGEWKFVYLSFYILHLINFQLESHKEVLSVQQSKHVKNCIKNVVIVGILTKLQPNLPLYIKSNRLNSFDIFLDYNILKCTTFGLCEFLKYLNLRLLILPDSLKAILVAIYQIGFCPLKKSATETANKDAVMTDEIYKQLIDEKQVFLKLLEDLRKSIHPGIFVKETMVIFHSNAPTWFKRSVSQSLTSIIRSENGVQNIALALLDGADNDNSQTWKVLEVFSKLILSCKSFPDFQDNICKQVIGMLDKLTEDSLVFERIFVHCTKSVYNADQELAKSVFVRKIVSYFLYFTYKDHKFRDGEILTDKIKQYVRLIHGVFTVDSVDSPGLPLEFLKPIMNVIFRLYAITLNTSFVSINNDLKDILTAYLNSNTNELFALFDCFLFAINTKELLPFRNDIVLKLEKYDIIINYSKQAISYPVAENSECLLKLLKNKTIFMVKLFGFLLNCLNNMDKYFTKANEELLNLETHFMNEYFEKKIIVYKLLSDLAEDKDIQKHITTNPGDIVIYIDSVLLRTIESSIHKTKDFESEGFQSVFTIIMILQELVLNCSIGNVEAYKILIEPLSVILKETSNEEIKNLIKKILEVIEKGEIKSTRMVVEEVKTELDKAIEDICDPLLPVRGHGLMELTKLVEKKDQHVLDRKQYVLNIFQSQMINTASHVLAAGSGVFCLVVARKHPYIFPQICFGAITANSLIGIWKSFQVTEEGGEAPPETEESTLYDKSTYVQDLLVMPCISSSLLLSSGYKYSGLLIGGQVIIPLIPQLPLSDTVADSLVLVLHCTTLGGLSIIQRNCFGVIVTVLYVPYTYFGWKRKEEYFGMSGEAISCGILSIIALGALKTVLSD